MHKRRDLIDRNEVGNAHFMKVFVGKENFVDNFPDCSPKLKLVHSKKFSKTRLDSSWMKRNIKVCKFMETFWRAG